MKSLEIQERYFIRSISGNFLQIVFQQRELAPRTVIDLQLSREVKQDLDRIDTIAQVRNDSYVQ